MLLSLLVAGFAGDTFAVDLLQLFGQLLVVLIRVGRPASLRLGLDADGVGSGRVVPGRTHARVHQLGQALDQVVDRPYCRRLRFRSLHPGIRKVTSARREGKPRTCLHADLLDRWNGSSWFGLWVSYSR